MKRAYGLCNMMHMGEDANAHRFSVLQVVQLQSRKPKEYLCISVTPEEAHVAAESGKERMTEKKSQ